MAQNTPPQNESHTSQTRWALQRLLLIISIVVVLIIIAYGWQITNIDLSITQEPQRQVSLGNAMRDLFSPNIFQQEHTIVSTSTSFVMTCPEGSALPESTTTDDSGMTISLDPPCGDSGDLVTVRGSNIAPGEVARINWIAEDGDRRIRQVEGSNEDNFVTRDDGTFEVKIEVPRIRASGGQTHTVELQIAEPVGAVGLSDMTHQVLDKMVETIMVALIATLLAIPPSVVLSFLAARNLMQPIRVPIGGLLVTFTLLPIGWMIGSVLLGQLGMFTLDIARGTSGGVTGSTSLLLGMAAVAAAGRSRIPQEPQNGVMALGRSIGTLLIGAAIGVAVIGLLGGIGQLLQRSFTDGIPGLITGFLGSVGQLIELTLPLIGGFVGVVVLSSIGTRLSRGALKTISGTPSHVLGGILGGLAGAILLGMAGTLGLGAAWLGLLTPLAAAGLGSAVLPQFYNLISPKPPLTATATAQSTHRGISLALAWVGALLAFFITFAILNVGQAVVASTLPPQVIVVNLLGIGVTAYVAKAMAIGLILGGISGILIGMRAAFPLGSVTYNITRTMFNLVRAIEPLIMALVFIIWVGIGPFAGVLALTLHSIASLGKLYSEQIENIDLGPLEALQSTGANRLQIIIYAVIPQVIPSFISFTVYRWDINVRMSTIIGFVGGGGIGALLYQQINLLRYRDAGVAVLAIAIVVSVLDYASAAIRERYI